MFRDEQTAKYLLLVDVVTNVHVDVTDVSPDLGVEFDFLARKKLARD
jgi:hypothetical protein